MKIEIIKNCPSCNSLLVREKDQLFCKNSLCTATQTKKVLHFAKTIGIKGLGEKTLEKLPISSIRDIYNLSLEEAINSIGEKLGTKLTAEIERSKLSTLEKLLPAFSIPMVGHSAARKLSTKVSSIEEITRTVCNELKLGNVVTTNLLDWIDTQYYQYKDLPIKLEQKKQSERLKVCITGKLNDFKSRAEAAKVLADIGITVVSSVTKSLDYLVSDDNKPSSKLSKAQSYGIKIITLNQLIEEIKQ